MTLEWTENRLEAGRMLVRGWLTRDWPFGAKLRLSCKMRGAFPTSPPALAHFCYNADSTGSTVSFGSPGWISEWREGWRLVTEAWDAPGREAAFWDQLQVVVLDEAQNGVVLPPGDPRLLLHYGAMLEALQLPQRIQSLMPGERRVADAIAPKLRKLIIAQYQAWTNVVPV